MFIVTAKKISSSEVATRIFNESYAPTELEIDYRRLSINMLLLWSRGQEKISAAIAEDDCQDFGFSSGLFSFGLTVERTTMNLFNMSNQKGAPSETASAVISHPIVR